MAETTRYSEDGQKIRIINDTARVKTNNNEKESGNANTNIYVTRVEEDFNLGAYFRSIDKRIYEILQRIERDNLTYDILDTEKSRQNKLVALKEKQRVMKIGEIWQDVLGSYAGFINLLIGHETGLDLLSHSRKIAVELKNRTNTDNASSRKSNLDKLAAFKILNPEYICVYANINADTEEKTFEGKNTIIIHNGVEIHHQIGIKFLTFILGENTDAIISFVKDAIDKYT